MSDTERGLTPITLDYARPLTAAERLGDVDELIIAHAPLADFQKHFPNAREAAIYYARFLADRYSRANLDKTCIDCGVATEQIVIVNHAPIFHIKFWEFSASVDGYVVPFTTSHSMCAACYDAMRGRMRRYRLAIAARVALVLLGVAYLFWAAYEPAWTKFLKEHMGWWFYAPPMALILIAAISVAFKERQSVRRLPPRLRDCVGDDWVRVD